MHVLMRYNLSRLHQGEMIQKAEIRVKLHEQATKLYRLRITVRINGNKIRREKLRLNISGHTTDGFAIIDVTEILRSIANISIPINSVTLVDFTVYKKSQKTQSRDRRSIIEDDNKIHLEAFMIIFSRNSDNLEYLSSIPSMASSNLNVKKDLAARRSRALARRLRRKMNSKREICERIPMMVDFEYLGWGKWIIYPKVINAYACQGRCPKRVWYDLQLTNHAILQNLVRKKNRVNLPAPCCVPIALRPLSMMYHEKKEIVVRHHSDMIVDKCGCR